MSGVLEEIGAYLEAQSIGVVGQDIFLGRMPDSPASAIALVEYGGAPSDYIQEQAFASWEKPSVQVSVRNADPKLASDTAQLAYRAIDIIRNTTLSGTRYMMGRPIQRPFLLMRDANELTVMVFNAAFWRVAV